ncbi:MAG: VOC family protein [Acidiferrobacter sp.]
MMSDRPRASRGRVARIALNVADMARSVAFYTEALGFQVLGVGQEGARAQTTLLGGRCESQTLSLGGARLELTRFFEGSAPYPAHSRANDLWFQHFAILCQDIESLARTVRCLGGEPITQGPPQRLPATSGGVTAYKCRDPDGHPLELLLPVGDGGNKSAQASNAHGTVALDHTALSVADTGRAIAFYHDVLALDVETDHINRGVEQDRLDGLTGVRVRVVSLRTEPPGPRLELLGYEAPRGRTASWTPRDIAATRTVFAVADLHALERALYRGYRGASRRIDHTLLSQDPSGHWLLFEGEP